MKVTVPLTFEYNEWHTVVLALTQYASDPNRSVGSLESVAYRNPLAIADEIQRVVARMVLIKAEIASVKHD